MVYVFYLKNFIIQNVFKITQIYLAILNLIYHKRTIENDGTNVKIIQQMISSLQHILYLNIKIHYMSINHYQNHLNLINIIP